MLENLIHRKKRFEGLKLHLYYDSQNVLSGLYGHNFEHNHIPDSIIKKHGTRWIEKPPYSEEIASDFLHEDTVHSLKNVMNIFGKAKFGFNEADLRMGNTEALDSEFPYEVLTVLDDLMFNLGYYRFIKFKRFIHFIKAGDYYLASRELKWKDGSKQDEYTLYYSKIEDIVNSLEAQGISNTFHRAEENIALLLKACK